MSDVKEIDLSAIKTDRLLREISARGDEECVRNYMESHVDDAIAELSDPYGLDNVSTDDLIEEIRSRASMGQIEAAAILAPNNEHALGDPPDMALVFADGALEGPAAAFIWLLEAVAPIVEARNTIPILGMVHLRTQGAQLTVAATDLDGELSLTLPLALAETDDVFEICIPPRAVASALKAIAPDASVRLAPLSAERADDMPGHGLTIGWAGGEIVLPALPGADFPALAAEARLVASTDLDADFVARVLDRLRHAISSEETRYYLNGVCFWREGERAHAVATDGHRLAAIPFPLPQSFWTAHQTPILPAKAVDLWRRLFRARAVQFIALTGPLFAVRADFGAARMTLKSKLIDGAFPEWPKVVPKKFERSLSIRRDEVAMALAVCAAFAHEGRKSIALLSENERVFLTAGLAHDLGRARIELACERDNWPDRIGINGRYLADALTHMRGARVTLRQSADKESPIRVFSENDDEIFLLMPMRA